MACTEKFVLNKNLHCRKNHMPNTKGNKTTKGTKTKIKGKLKVAMLGGLNEIGKNIAVIEFGGDIIVVDCGLGFPDDEMLGVDLVIPDVGYLEKNN